MESTLIRQNKQLCQENDTAPDNQQGFSTVFTDEIKD